MRLGGFRKNRTMAGLVERFHKSMDDVDDFSSRVTASWNVTDFRSPRPLPSGEVSMHVFVNLLLAQLVLISLYLLTCICQHPLCAWLPCNCYDPSNCRTSAIWLYRIMRLVREAIIIAILFGTLVIIASDDCDRRMYSYLCQMNATTSLVHHVILWMAVGILVACVRECLIDSVWCSEAARHKEIDGRNFRLRKNQVDFSSIRERFHATNRVMLPDEPTFTVEASDDEEKQEASPSVVRLAGAIKDATSPPPPPPPPASPTSTVAIKAREGAKHTASCK